MAWASTLGLYPDANTFDQRQAWWVSTVSHRVLRWRLAPEYVMTGFGSTMQASPGFTIWFVSRFGKQ